MNFINFGVIYKSGLVFLCIMLHRVIGGVFGCCLWGMGGVLMALWGCLWLAVARMGLGGVQVGSAVSWL